MSKKLYAKAQYYQHVPKKDARILERYGYVVAIEEFDGKILYRHYIGLQRTSRDPLVFSETSDKPRGGERKR